MTDQTQNPDRLGPFMPGQECVITIDPEGVMTGRTVRIESRRAVRIGDPAVGRWITRDGAPMRGTGLLAQHIANENPAAPGRCTAWWPVAWMVPKGIDPDVELDIEAIKASARAGQ